MFIFRWIRNILALIGLIVVVLWALNHYRVESPILKKVEEIKKSGIIEEGVRDMQALAGEILGSSEKSMDSLTDEDRKKMDEMLAKELAPKKRVAKPEAGDKR